MSQCMLPPPKSHPTAADELIFRLFRYYNKLTFAKAKAVHFYVLFSGNPEILCC